MVRQKPKKTKKKKQEAGGTITSKVAKKLGKETSTQEFDRAVKSRVALSAKAETEKKAESRRRGIEFKPGEDLPEVPEKTVKSKLRGIGEDISAGEIDDKARFQEAGDILKQKNIELDITRTQNFLARSEGLSTFEELPLYQQFLADVAVTGGAGSALRGVGALRNVVGRAGAQQEAALIGKAVKPAKSAAGRFASNPKTQLKTGKMLLKRGVQAGVVAIIAGTIGTYPFAGFIKEEALQTLGLKTNSLREAGLFDEAEEFIKQREDVHKVGYEDFVPYLNVLNNLKDYFKADVAAIEADRKLIEKDKAILEGKEQSQFDKLKAGSKQATERGDDLA